MGKKQPTCSELLFSGFIGAVLGGMTAGAGCALFMWWIASNPPPYHPSDGEGWGFGMMLMLIPILLVPVGIIAGAIAGVIFTIFQKSQ